MNPRNVGSATTRMLKRHLEMRDILTFVNSSPDRTITQVAEQFEWTRTKARSAVLLLAHLALLEVTQTSGTHTNHYSLAAFSEDDLDARLPITVNADGRLVRPVVGRLVQRKSKFTPYRPWMIALLMGSSTGRAPSLNFMDSMKGA